MKTMMRCFSLVMYFLVHFSKSQNGKDDIVLLEENTFKNYLKEKEAFIVFFYSPDCNYSTKFYPEYQNVSKIYRNESSSLVFTKVDISVSEDLANKYEILDTPSVILFLNGLQIDYNGFRNESDLLNWLKETFNQSPNEIENIDQIKSLEQMNNISIIFFGSKNSESHKSFEFTAKVHTNINFYSCFFQDCLNYFSLEGEGAVLIKNFDEKRNVLKGPLTNEKLNKFINTHSLPFISKFNEDLTHLVFGKGNPALVLFRNNKTTNIQETDQVFYNAAKAVKSHILSSICDFSSLIEERLAEYLGAFNDDAPTVIIADSRAEFLKYKMNTNYTIENIIEFVNNWSQNKLTPYFKSEKAPLIQTGDIVVLVGKTFEEEVYNNDLDVLVMFYSPNCLASNKFKPLYEIVAAELKNKTKLKIAMFDGENNELKNIGVRNFPTIRLFPSGKKDTPIQYEGEKKKEEFVNWIIGNVTHTATPKKEEL